MLIRDTKGREDEDNDKGYRIAKFLIIGFGLGVPMIYLVVRLLS